MSVENFELTPEQRELEKALGGIVPASVAIDRDALMFAAGRASISRPLVWPWRVAACVGFSLSVGLGVMAMRERPTPPGIIAKSAPSSEIPEARNDGTMAAALLNVDASVESGADSSPWSYYNLRNEALNWGVNVLPTAPNGGAGAVVEKEDRAVKGLSFRQFIFNAGGRS